MSLRILNAADVEQLLPMAECIDVMAAAMAALSAGKVVIPPRLVAPLIDGGGVLILMPGSVAAPKTYGAKVVSIHSDNPGRGLPAIQGFVTLFDAEDGRPRAIIEGSSLTLLRTAAASGLATRILARAGAETCGIFGTGPQALSHIAAIAAVRPIQEFIIWGRSGDKARALMAEAEKTCAARFRVTENPTEAGASDIICTVTGSDEPVLMGQWVRPGAHVNLVGAYTATTREADTALMREAAIYVDLMESARNEAGDILIPLQAGAISWGQVRGEIGQVALGRVAGRRSDSEITLYKSLGVTAQDLFAAHYVLEKAEARNIGVEVAF